MVVTRSFLLTALMLMLSEQSFSFVLISGPTEAKLDVSETSPTVVFQVSSSLPNITEKDKFLDGQYQDLDDDAFAEAIIRESMERWNRVTTSYINLTYEFTDSYNFDSEDRVHTIGIGDTNLVSAATASPNVEGNDIIDCDIRLGSKSATAENFAYTVVHELGHCLGLGHNHSDYGALMGYARTDYSLTLGADDVLGVTYLYPNSTVGVHKELIACGSIGTQNNSSKLALLLLLLFPLTLLTCRTKPFHPKNFTH